MICVGRMVSSKPEETFVRSFEESPLKMIQETSVPLFAFLIA